MKTRNPEHNNDKRVACVRERDSDQTNFRLLRSTVGEEQFVARMRSLAERIRAADAVKAAREEAVGEAVGGEGGSVLGRITSLGRSLLRQRLGTK